MKNNMNHKYCFGSRSCSGYKSGSRSRTWVWSRLKSGPVSWFGSWSRACSWVKSGSGSNSWPGSWSGSITK